MKLSIQSQDNGVVQLELQGSVSQRDFASDAEPFNDVLGPECFHQTILLDMSEVAQLDSSGVNWLLVSQKKIRETGGNLVLHSLSPIAMNVIKVLNLHSVFKLADNANAARNLVGGDPS